MADTKLNDLASGAPAAGTDIIYAVKDPAGTPVDRKLSLENVKDYIIGLANTWSQNQTFSGGVNKVTITAPETGSTLTIADGKTLTANNTLTLAGTDSTTMTFPSTSATIARTDAANSFTGSQTLESTAELLWSTDLRLTRRGAANLRLGAADAASPVAQTLSVQSVVAGTTNTAGANLTITGSQGTGTGAGGSIIFQVAPAGSSGTAQNSLVTFLEATSSRAFNLYNTTDVTTNFERGKIAWESNALRIGTEKGGTGTARALEFQTDGTTRLTIGTGGTITVGSGGFIRGVSADTGLAWTGTSPYLFNGSTQIGLSSALVWFNGTTSSFPALKRSSTTLQVRLADDSANAALESASLKTDAPTGGTSGTWKLGTVATVSPTSPNRTIEVDIGGTIYYIHAKTTND